MYQESLDEVSFSILLHESHRSYPSRRRACLFYWVVLFFLICMGSPVMHTLYTHCGDRMWYQVVRATSSNILESVIYYLAIQVLTLSMCLPGHKAPRARRVKAVRKQVQLYVISGLKRLCFHVLIYKTKINNK